MDLESGKDTLRGNLLRPIWWLILGTPSALDTHLLNLQPYIPVLSFHLSGENCIATRLMPPLSAFLLFIHSWSYQVLPHSSRFAH